MDSPSVVVGVDRVRLALAGVQHVLGHPDAIRPFGDGAVSEALHRLDSPSLELVCVLVSFLFFVFFFVTFGLHLGGQPPPRVSAKASPLHGLSGLFQT